MQNTAEECKDSLWNKMDIVDKAIRMDSIVRSKLMTTSLVYSPVRTDIFFVKKNNLDVSDENDDFNSSMIVKKNIPNESNETQHEDDTKNQEIDENHPNWNEIQDSYFCYDGYDD